MIIPDENGNTVIDPVRESAYRWMCQLGRLAGGHSVNIIWNQTLQAENVPVQVSFSNENIKQIKIRKVIEALKKTGWNQRRAADIVGLHQSTVGRIMKKYGLKNPRLL